MASRTKELQQIMEGFHTFKRGMESAILCSCGDFRITNSEWLALDILSREGSASIKMLSSELGISSSATTQVVNALVKRGYAVKRSLVSDGRVTVVALSEKTERTLATLRTQVLRNMNKVFAVLSDREFATFQSLQAKLVSAFIKNK